MEINYEVLGDITSALNHIDQAQSEFERNSPQFVALGRIYQQLKRVDLDAVYMDYDPENIYNLPSITQSIEEDRRGR
jgi:hypothetical protein